MGWNARCIGNVNYKVCKKPKPACFVTQLIASHRVRLFRGCGSEGEYQKSQSVCRQSAPHCPLIGRCSSPKCNAPFPGEENSRLLARPQHLSLKTSASLPLQFYCFTSPSTFPYKLNSHWSTKNRAIFRTLSGQPECFYNCSNAPRSVTEIFERKYDPKRLLEYLGLRKRPHSESWMFIVENKGFSL